MRDDLDLDQGDHDDFLEAEHVGGYNISEQGGTAAWYCPKCNTRLDDDGFCEPCEKHVRAI